MTDRFNFLTESSQNLLANFNRLVQLLDNSENLVNANIEDLQIRIELWNAEIARLNNEIETLLRIGFQNGLQVTETERDQWNELVHRNSVVTTLSPYIIAFSMNQRLLQE